MLGPRLSGPRNEVCACAPSDAAAMSRAINKGWRTETLRCADILAPPDLNRLSRTTIRSRQKATGGLRLSTVGKILTNLKFVISSNLSFRPRPDDLLRKSSGSVEEPAVDV